MNTFNNVSGDDISAIWQGSHSFLGDRVPVAYNWQFHEDTQEPISALIGWQQDGDEFFLLSNGTDPDEWVGYVLDWDSDHSDRVLLSYYLHGSADCFTRTSMEEARTGDITELELFHLNRVRAFLADHFGADTILVAEVEHAWDVDTYAKLGFFISEQAYIAPILEGADAEVRSAGFEEGHGTTYKLAGIRAGASDVPVTEEELADSASALDAIYASGEVAREEREHSELAVGALQTVASEIEQPPTADNDDAN